MKRYFFFGSNNVIEEFLNNGMEDINYFLTIGFAISQFEPGYSPDEVMGNAVFYGGYIEITEKQYNEIYDLCFSENELN